MQAASVRGAAIASIHPIRSFAVPEKIIHDFAGTYGGIEGDQRALDILAPLFTAIDAQLVTIKSEEKILYHAAAVFASNYLVTLLDTAVRTYAQVGIPQDVALKIELAPLVKTTFLIFKWELRSVGLCTSACAAPQSSTSTRARV